MSLEKLEIMEDAAAKEEVENTPTVTNNFRWYCYLEEAIRVFLRCLGFEIHESGKSGEEKEVAVDSSSSSMSSEKEGEKCKVNEPAVQDSSSSSSSSNSGGATFVPAASTTVLDAAADSPSTPDPAVGSPAAISVEDVATTAARRPSSRPPINNGSGPQTN